MKTEKDFAVLAEQLLAYQGLAGDRGARGALRLVDAAYDVLAQSVDAVRLQRP